MISGVQTSVCYTCRFRTAKGFSQYFLNKLLNCPASCPRLLFNLLLQLRVVNLNDKHSLCNFR